MTDVSSSLENAIAQRAVSGPLTSSLLDRLQGTGRLNHSDVERVHAVLQHSDSHVVDILVQLGLLTERELAVTIAEIARCEVATAEDFPKEALYPTQISRRFLRDSRLCPIAEVDGHVHVAARDPNDGFAVQALSMALSKPVRLVAAAASDIEDAVSRLYGGLDYSVDTKKAATDSDLERLRDAAQEAPVIRFVERLIARAVEDKASDIHIEPQERALRIRVRIDGILQERENAPFGATAAIISRIKLLARLDIAERRLPQDGSIKMNVRGREVDLRVATTLTAHGECVVIRILDKQSVRLELGALGFEPAKLLKIQKCLARPNGLFLVTGPTGSGKTTTLYAALNNLNIPSRKIITIEDPVEYKIKGLNQIQVKPEIGLDFARALRSILRQDPNVIMVGEIRDAETARIAIQSALTGHLVLSTLHTNDAASAATRLLDMGIEHYLVASTLAGVLAQRLVRRLCDNCKRPLESPAGTPAGNALAGAYQATGCPDCGRTGYRGRMVISELLVPNDQFRQLVGTRGDAGQLRLAAREAGMISLYEQGMHRIREGVTTYEEVSQVAGDFAKH